MPPQCSTLKGLNSFFKFASPRPAFWWGGCSGICMQDCNCLQREMSFRRRLQTEISVFVFKTDITENSSLNSTARNPSQQFADTPTSVFILQYLSLTHVEFYSSVYNFTLCWQRSEKWSFQLFILKTKYDEGFFHKEFYVPLQSKNDEMYRNW